MGSVAPTLRVARPTNDLAQLRAFYVEGAGFAVLAEFAGHNGFDGLIVGYTEAPWHLEFTREVGVVAPTCSSSEQLMVLYFPDSAHWQRAVDRMVSFGTPRVTSNNPYWNELGASFRDPDGYGLTFQNAAWLT